MLVQTPILPQSIEQDIPVLRKTESIPLILVKLAISFILGNFCLKLYPVPVNVAAFAGIFIMLFDSLRRKDGFSFLVQVFFLNHFITGNEFGGVFNLAAVFAIVMSEVVYGKRGAFGVSSLNNATKIFLGILLLCQFVAMIGGDKFGMSQRALGFIIFTALVTLVYFLSKVSFELEDYKRLFYLLFIFSLFILYVSFNQRLNFSGSNFLPNYNADADFEFDFIRSGGTFLNYEAYGEYSLSMMVLVIPGLISGSFWKEDVKLFFACVGIFAISLVGVILSGTRSSFFLLPLAVVFILFWLGRRMQPLLLLLFAAFTISAYYVNQQYQLIDLNIFEERSANMDLQHLTFGDLLSGSQMNRGDIFGYAFNKIGQSGGLVGEGYYTKVEAYKMTHFDSATYPIIDYHNFYLSSIVLWGFAGAIAFVAIFILTIISGISLYAKSSIVRGFHTDLLLGFNTVFIFFMINQYKIQFIRECNYMIVILTMLLIYKSLIKTVRQEKQIAEEEAMEDSLINL
ncbi:MAG: hypothetical protein C5B52_00110 [Bacteroidetes bacterium]|nr:MAG: hypothetical protein C5B52_00110 [Bacteroidota bacterium]